MKKVKGAAVTVGVLSVIGLLLTGCDWESGDDFNTARGAGAEINFSGIYRARSGGDLLSNGTESLSIVSLMITHVGNAIEVRDSANSYYRGNCGAPGVVASPDENGLYPAGAVLLQTQINFEGTDGQARRNVSFVGVLRVVSITSITSTTRTLTIDEAELQQTTTVTYTVNEGNSKYVLEGNWVEGSQVFALNAEAIASSGGTFQTVATATTTGNNTTTTN